MIRKIIAEVLGSNAWDWLPSACWRTATRMEDVCEFEDLVLPLFWFAFFFSGPASIGFISFLARTIFGTQLPQDNQGQLVQPLTAVQPRTSSLDHCLGSEEITRDNFGH
ncbi:hypothetical protein WAI453_005390 [Rhynchosporium graminicola]